MAEDCIISTQLIDDNGVLVASSLEEFVESVKLSDCGVSYTVVAIIGPQSSGKSTLMNRLFYTKFDVMNDLDSRRQTTKGVWIDKAVDVDPVTIVLDIEGSDGNERGEDNLLERQTALFALALADVVLINMWCAEIGRICGSRCMIRTVFQVMVRLFPPCRTTLLFVMRDKTRTPPEVLESILRDDLQKIWGEVKKPEYCKNANLSDFCSVQVTALSHIEYEQEDFTKEVAQLRERFHNSIGPGGLTANRKEKVPGSRFSVTVKDTWQTSKQCKDLALPAQKVMVAATISCDAIALDLFTHLCSSKVWLELDAAAKEGIVSEFGKRLTFILTSCLSQYDKETMQLDESVRQAKRLQLHTEMIKLVCPTYHVLLDHYVSQAKTKFESELKLALRLGQKFAASSRDLKESSMLQFDNQCKDADVQQATHLDATSHREKLLCDIDEHISTISNNKLNEIVTSIEDTKDPSLIFFLLPEDYEIEKDTVIQLWMAAEYIQDELNGASWFEVFGLHYLLNCGTNFVTGKNRYRIDTQKIDELRIRQKSNASYYLKWEKEGQKIIPMHTESIKHVSLGCSPEIGTETFETLKKLKQLKTLLFLGNRDHRLIQMLSSLFPSFSELHTLDLSRTPIKELPSSIGYMVHLRYLDLSWTLIKLLPDILCSLSELQTLKLRGCSNLSVLPKELNKLTELRHLDVDVLGQLEVIPKGIGALVHLRTLPAFLVGIENGCKIKELRTLNNLSGELCIAKLENVEDGRQALGANLREKNDLKKLELRWTASEICGRHHYSDHILERLRPSKNLKELQIVCYEGTNFPSWIGDPEFNTLARIKFYLCENVLNLPLIGHLPLLKHLELVGINGVRKIELQSESVIFPKLERLEISEMQILQVWYLKKRNEGDFCSLTHLIIHDCPELEEFDVLPHLSSIKYFEIRECPKLHSLSDMILPYSLQELIVDECPQIQKRCVEGEGEDWHKIEHVSNKSIQEVNKDEYEYDG